MKHDVKTTDFDFEYTGSSFNEKDVIEKGFRLLSGAELLSKITDKVILGDYLMGYKYITEFYEDGTAEGINHVGSHNFGSWVIDLENHTMVTKWDNGWFDTVTRAYEVDGNIELFDVDTGNWRTTFKDIKPLRSM